MKIAHLFFVLVFFATTALAQTNTSAARTNAETAQQSSGLDSLVKIGSTILSFLG